MVVPPNRFRTLTTLLSHTGDSVQLSISCREKRRVISSISRPTLHSTTFQEGAEFSRSVLMQLCTPGMGVNLWGVSPLYVNPVNILIY